MNEEYLDGKWIRGYTQGLLDVLEVIGYIDSDVRAHGNRMNKEIICKIINEMIMHRVELREKRNGFLRCVGKGKGMVIEFYEEKK